MKGLDYTAKNIIKKTMIGVITLSLVFSPSLLVWAEDYPDGYVGPGHREYLSGRIQEGYYVEEFTEIDQRQKERVDKRNQVEEILVYSYQATPKSANRISDVALLEQVNSQKLNVEIALRRQQRQQGAAAQGEFTYIPYSDGKKVYFKDGLVSKIENEKVPDEFGNINIKNTYNMQYNDKRLLSSYEADLKDDLGNATHLSWFGAQYTADSLFYGGEDTLANRNLAEFWLKETDSAGNVKLTHFHGGSYAGKFLSAFSQTIEDSIFGNLSFSRTNITYANGDPDQAGSYLEKGIGTDGLTYTLQRTKITFNGKDQLTGYHEERATLYPAPDNNPTLPAENRTVKTTVDTQFEYLPTGHQLGPDIEEPEPDRLLKSIITATTENPDGSFRTETTTTTYDYNSGLKASGNSLFFGQETAWFDRETQTYKEGEKFSGTSEIQYEILRGRPMMKQVDSLTSYYSLNYNPHTAERYLLRTEKSTINYANALVNNFQRVLNAQEHTEVTYSQVDKQGNPQRETKDITTSYIYANNGNLLDAQAVGKSSGYELTGEGWKEFSGEINIDYGVDLGRALEEKYAEKRHYQFR